MKGNIYWAQHFDGKTYEKMDPAKAISPIFNTKKQYTEWLKEARKNGLTDWRNCADHINTHFL